MADQDGRTMTGVTRRDFLRWLGVGSGTAALGGALPLNLLAAASPGENPLAGSINRNWEKIYRDQYKYDRHFDWVCSPNDTHACRVRAYVRNGIVTRLGATYDYQNYADLYGNKATANWNPRQCAKGYTFHRVIYGP
ncbi:MAG: twin-arginine translocation signal domain-containing protein, partial [Deltaproteobacteria bacterium]|nr:twin-arginine translocation signal domain-containing protein [Deltaproteobacteria bacterium]